MDRAGDIQRRVHRTLTSETSQSPSSTTPPHPRTSLLAVILTGWNRGGKFQAPLLRTGNALAKANPYDWTTLRDSNEDEPAYLFVVARVRRFMVYENNNNLYG
jgi:hypothetical protein